MSITISLLMLLFPLASFSTSESIFLLLRLELILYALTAKLFEVGVKRCIWHSLEGNTWTELVLPAYESVPADHEPEENLLVGGNCDVYGQRQS